ncbi:Transposon Ty3-I Gag-Pol polyprotein [Labeo rohita]|uniref:Transposon Ty3-I Gag-Pol polyprotein n=1 Tax=Labeo rohita TaxID=84645 RepID=A0ABQ8MVU5_LABRO|nr:Transposon Ty3-I Gag-Pol polyprotein [Labeo rohita]
MEDLLKCLTEVSIRQQQIVEHIATRQEKVEEDLAALRHAAGQRAPPPDPHVQAAQLIPKLTNNDDIELYLQMFETLAGREGWDRGEWAQVLGPLLTREAQQKQQKINLLKRWVGTREQLSALAHTDPAVVDMGDHLSAAQKTELQHLISQFSDVFSTRPGQTNVIEHDIRTAPGVIVRQRPYQVLEAGRQAIEDEISEMLKLVVIEPSRSTWSSPIVMVPKPDGTHDGNA